MLNLMKRCLSFVDPSTRLQAMGVIVLMILGALLEAIGIGLVFPLVKVISEPASLSQFAWAIPALGNIAPENEKTVLAFIAIGFLGVIVFKNGFLLLTYVVQGRFFTSNEALLARRLFEHYLRGDYRLHLTRNSATLINNVISTASSVYSHALTGFMTIGIEVFLVAILAVVLLVADPLMTIGALVMISIAVGVFYGAIKKRLTAWGERSTLANQRILKVLQQGLHSIKEIKVLGREDFILHDFDVPRQEFAVIQARIFVARKITRALSRIKTGLQDMLYIGNLESLRDWGHARDFVEAMWLILQQDYPDDYVIATGKQYTVRHFIELGGAELDMDIMWQGNGADEIGIDRNTGKQIIAVEPRYFRPTEVENLLGDPTKVKKQLGWEPKIGCEELIKEMISSDLAAAKRDALIENAGYRAFKHHE